MKKNHNSIWRYTLIELLVTITIIGILSSLLISALKVAQDKEKQVSCLNNMRQIGTYTTMYIGDNYNFFPTNSKATKWSWDDRLSDYDGRRLTDAAKNKQGNNLADVPAEGEAENHVTYSCPADTVKRNGKRIIRSYAPNQYEEDKLISAGIISLGTIEESKRNANISEPSQSIVFSELINVYNAVGHVGNSTEAINAKRMSDSSKWVHNEFESNYIMADGRGAFMKFEDTVTAVKNLSSGEVRTQTDPLVYSETIEGGVLGTLWDCN